MNLYLKYLQRSSSLILAIWITGLLSLQTAEAQNHPFDDLWNSLVAGSWLEGDPGPEQMRWFPGEERFSHLWIDPESGQREIRLRRPGQEEEERLLSEAELTDPESGLPVQIDQYHVSPDGRYLLIEANTVPVWRHSGVSDLYLYEIESETLERISQDVFTAEFSPDSRWVGLVINGEIHTYRIQTGELIRQTTGATDTLFNGRFGWVYEEEFGLVQAWEWSPDSRKIAFWQSDESDVPTHQMTDFEGKYPEYTELPYPKAGEPNPTVRIGVLDLETEDVQWVTESVTDGYIPRIYWTARPATLATLGLNRQQTRVELTLHELNGGKQTRLLTEETDEGWIDLYDFFSGLNHPLFFPENREHFYWLSDRDGWTHLYRYGYDGELLEQVTRGEWEVTDIHHIDETEGALWYSSTEVSPLERHLYRLDLESGERQQITEARGVHEIEFAPDGTWYRDRHSALDRPWQTELYRTGESEPVEILGSRQEIESGMERFNLPARELFRLVTSEGDTLDGWIMKPSNASPEQPVPLMWDIYGGPGSQGVRNEFDTSGWRQHLLRLGIAVANLNPRGSGGYGRAFEKQVYGQIGLLESDDLAHAAAELPKQYDWVDPERMALRGHSYGGYLAVLAQLRHPDLFPVAIAGAPVTDWRLYDTIYTERYMNLPDANRSGYDQNSLLTHADKLAGRLLLVHSGMDENVHLQQTMQLVRAFTDAEKDVDLRIYPPGSHGVAYNRASYLLLHRAYTQYLLEHLIP
ncbi:MAG: S9 family peptidase [Bacteroidota bacterium]